MKHINLITLLLAAKHRETIYFYQTSKSIHLPRCFKLFSKPIQGFKYVCDIRVTRTTEPLRFKLPAVFDDLVNVEL